MPVSPDRLLRYGAHPDQLADLRLPPKGSAQALVLFLHGGYWRQAYDRHHAEDLTIALAGRGYAVASLEYRRVRGAGGWPATFDDVAAAVDQLPELARAVGAVPAGSPVALVGHSAGGHLALWAAGRHRLPRDSPWHRSTAPDLRGTVALAPVADLARAAELGLSDDAAAELLGGRGPGWIDRLARADPTRLPPGTPVIVLHGDQDDAVPLELSRRYVDAVEAAGADVTLEVIAGADHFAVIEPDSLAWPRVLAALERVLPAS